MAASFSSEVLGEELKDAGNRLLMLPPSTSELLSLLDELEHLLSMVEQAPPKPTLDALLPVKKALIAHELLRHSEINVKVSVASCMNEVMRVTAPDVPYNDERMKEVFELTVTALEKLSLVSGRCYTKAVSILHNVAGVKSCLVMLDLEFDELIVEMFQLFLNTIRSDHPHSVFSDMENIMTLVIEETEEIPLQLLIPLLSSVKKESQSALPFSWKLGENVLKKCAAKLEPYLPPAVQFMGIDLSNFAEIVFSICQDASGKEHIKTLPFCATGSSNSNDCQLNKASKIKGKRKRIPQKEEVSEIAVSMKNYGEELVGCVIKVWWPLDQRFYKGAVSSFDPVEKRHEILYSDGDEELLDLSTEHWMLVTKTSFTEEEQGNNLSNSDALSDTKMDSMDASSLLALPCSTEVDANNPLWNYVTILEKRSVGGGNVLWQCNFCKVVKHGSYTRVKGHLLNLPSSGVRPCEKITSKDVAAMQRLEDEAKKKKMKIIRKMDSGDASSLLSPVITEEKNNALWNYVTRLSTRRDGGNVTWQCNFCNVIKKGSYTRVRGHFLNLPSSGGRLCPKFASQGVASMQRIENEAKGTNK